MPGGKHLPGRLQAVRLDPQRPHWPWGTMNLDLAGKVAIVTGSSKGLGLASARALAQEGCRVTICARGETSLNEAAAELRTVTQWPADVLPVVADVSTAAGVETVIARAVDLFGGRDILVKNAGRPTQAGIST